MYKAVAGEYTVMWSSTFGASRKGFSQVIQFVVPGLNYNLKQGLAVCLLRGGFPKKCCQVSGRASLYHTKGLSGELNEVLLLHIQRLRLPSLMLEGVWHSWHALSGLLAAGLMLCWLAAQSRSSDSEMQCMSPYRNTERLSMHAIYSATLPSAESAATNLNRSLCVID